jgi:hypothetical protein
MEYAIGSDATVGQDSSDQFSPAANRALARSWTTAAKRPLAACGISDCGGCLRFTEKTDGRFDFNDARLGDNY